MAILITFGSWGDFFSDILSYEGGSPPAVWNEFFDGLLFYETGRDWVLGSGTTPAVWNRFSNGVLFYEDWLSKAEEIIPPPIFPSPRYTLHGYNRMRMLQGRKL